MSESMHRLLEAMPLVGMVASGNARQFEFKDFVAAILVGFVSAVAGSVMTVQKMEVKVDMIEKNNAAIVRMIDEDRDLRRREREEILAKVIRIEAERATQQRYGK